MEEKLKKHLIRLEQRLKNGVSNSGILLLKQLKIIQDDLKLSNKQLKTIQNDLKLSNKTLQDDRREATCDKTQILNGVAKGGKDPTSVKSKLTPRKQTRS